MRCSTANILIVKYCDKEIPKQYIQLHCFMLSQTNKLYIVLYCFTLCQISASLSFHLAASSIGTIIEQIVALQNPSSSWLDRVFANGVSFDCGYPDYFGSLHAC